MHNFLLYSLQMNKYKNTNIKNYYETKFNYNNITFYLRKEYNLFN